MFCPNCSAEIEDGLKQCPECSVEITEEGALDNNKSSDINNTVIQVEKSSADKFFLRLFNKIKNVEWNLKTTVAVVSAAVIVICAVLFALPNVNKNYLVYLKDNKLEFSTSGNYNENQILSSHINMSYSDDIYIDKKGKRFFYPFDSTENGDGYMLYCGKSNSLDESGTQLGTDVIDFCTVKDSRAVYYLTDNSALYYYDFKKIKKVYSNVVKFYVNEETADVLWQTEEGDIYYQSFGESKELLARKVNLLYVSDSINECVYAGDGGVLYSHKIGSDAVIISVSASDAKILSADSIYYLVKSAAQSEEVGLSELYMLYYYDGEESTLLTENSKVIDSGLETAVMFSRTGTTKDDYAINIIIKDKVIPVNLVYSDIIDISIDYTGNIFYYIIGTQQENTLCYAEIDLENATLKEAVKIDKNVSEINRVNYSFSNHDGNDYYYFKHINDDGFGDLYIKNTKVAENVNTSTVIYAYGKDSYVFCSDIYADSNIGTLVTAEHDGVKVIGENVTQYSIVGGDDIAFICDAQSEEKTGVLKVYKDNRIYSVDEGVSKICYFTKAEKE